MHPPSTLISYMLLPDVGMWCNTLACGNHTQQILHHMTSPLVSVLFVPSLHSYYFSRNFLFFYYILVTEDFFNGEICSTLSTTGHTYFCIPMYTIAR